MNRKIYQSERLLLVAVFVIIAFAIIVYFRPYPNEYKHNYQKFWLKKTTNSKKYDIVVIGDSRIYRGISPKVISEKLNGVSVLNFGYSSARLNDFMFSQAEKKLDMSSNNKAIIIGITPNALTVSSNENDHILEFLNMPKEEQLEILYFYDFLKLFAPIRKKDFRKSDKNSKPNYIQDFEADGWVASDKIPEDTTEAFESYTSNFEDNKVSLNRVDDLCKKTKLWVNQGIKVYAFRFPTSVSMKNIEDSLSGFNEKLISEKIEKEGGIWLEFNFNRYHSYDGSHLDKESAINFSFDLAKKLTP
jgi:hypothetical protein